MNSTIITFAVVAVAIALVAVLLFQLTKGKSGGSSEKKPQVKNRSAILKSASQKLAQNPRDIQALTAVGDIYYEEESWEKALGIYNTLASLASSHPGKVNEFECTLRTGICALKLNRLDVATKSLVAARNLSPSNTEANFHLGTLYFMQKNYEKAIPMLRIASQTTPQNTQALKYLGIALQKTGHYKEAITALRKVLDAYPGDKDLLFSVGECFYETGIMDNALKIFLHLRPDPTFGPQASLYSGIIHTQMEIPAKAIEDFEIGLKHQNAPQNIYVEIRYRYALLLIKMQDISRATTLLREIQKVHPGYKDTTALLSRYQELNNNLNLQVYLLAGQSEFIMLCRKIVSHFYAKAKVKITDISAVGDYTDIVTEIDTSKWSDVVIFRFFRSQSTIGELPVRDLYGRIKDLKAGRGICFSGGAFSDGAKQFIEGRPIDLYGKEGLKRVLDRMAIDRKAKA